MCHRRVVPESVLPELVEPEVVPPVAAPQVVELPEVELLEEFDVERRLVRELDDDEEDEDESSSSFDEPGREPSLLQRSVLLLGSTVSLFFDLWTDAPHPLSNSLVYLMNSPEWFSGAGRKIGVVHRPFVSLHEVLPDLGRIRSACDLDAPHVGH